MTNSNLVTARAESATCGRGNSIWSNRWFWLVLGAVPSGSPRPAVLVMPSMTQDGKMPQQVGVCSGDRKSGSPVAPASPAYCAAIALAITTLPGVSGSAAAGPCTTEIAQTEAALDAVKSSPGAHQSLSAQLHRQPTPRSIADARERAATDEQHDRAALERARDADARGDEAACWKALAEAQRGISRR